VPVRVVTEVDDYVPPFDGAPPELAARLAGEKPDPERAASALARFARPAEIDTHELIVTHSFQVAWFVRDALGAPDWRWMTMYAANCALTTILYRDDRPPWLLTYNDRAHLPQELQESLF
jgi:serine/threonine-protein phosphatase PGAM5